MWFRKKIGKFHIEKSGQASIEVDNDLYGFNKQRDVDDMDSKQPEDHYEEFNTPNVEAVQADNPMYGNHQGQANNPLYGTNTQGGSLNTNETYSNINFDTRKVQMDSEPEYSYCKF